MCITAICAILSSNQCVKFSAYWFKNVVKRRIVLIMDLSLGKTNHEIASDLGKQIKNARLQINRTQADIAMQANVSRRALQALEAGDGSSLETFIAVCRCIGKTDWIYTFAPTPTVNPMLVLQLKTRAEKMIRKRAAKRSSI